MKILVKNESHISSGWDRRHSQSGELVSPAVVSCFLIRCAEEILSLLITLIALCKKSRCHLCTCIKQATEKHLADIQADEGKKKTWEELFPSICPLNHSDLLVLAKQLDCQRHSLEHIHTLMNQAKKKKPKHLTLLLQPDTLWQFTTIIAKTGTHDIIEVAH